MAMMPARGTRAGTTKPQQAILATVDASGATQRPGGTTDTAAAPQSRSWALWFPAKQSLSVTGVTKTGKPKRNPPRLPPNVNERSNMTWPVERAISGYWKLLAKTMAQYADIPKLQRARISAVVHRRSLGVADEDGDQSRIKPLIDGLREAHVIPNDTRKFVEMGTVSECHMDERGPGIALIVEELDQQPDGG